MSLRLFFLNIIILSHPLSALSQSGADGIVVDTLLQGAELDDVVVSAARNDGAKVLSNGSVLWATQSLTEMPRVLGNADPVRMIQNLPGVQTNGEYDGGLHIQGCESGHSMIAIDGVPIYNPAHFLGLFSAINANHYSDVSLVKMSSDAAMPNRIGGVLDLRHGATPHAADSLSADAEVGLISSQATVRLPLGRSARLVLSGRVSYFNLLYGSWISSDENEIGYHFWDANASLFVRLTETVNLSADFYGGRDVVRLDDRSKYHADMKLNWGNDLQAVHVNVRRPESPLSMRHTAYRTHYASRFAMSAAGMGFDMPAFTEEVGLKTDLRLGPWTFGAQTARHDTRPQAPDMSGSYNSTHTDVRHIVSSEHSAWLGWRTAIGTSLSLTTGVRGSIFHSGGVSHYGVDPMVSLLYDSGRWQISSTLCAKHQFLHHTGFTASSLPTEFWLPASETAPPQSALCASISSSTQMAHGVRLSAEVYLRQMERQVEYEGTVMDFLTEDYDLDSHLQHGRGQNYGLSLMAQRTSGRVTGWLSYTYARALRRLRELGADVFPSNHDRPHEVNAVATCKISERWSLSATAVYASGTPFTAPSNIYFISGTIISEYGRHNANRLAPYFRADVSVCYRWTARHGLRHGLNLSVYNATDHENQLFYSVRQYKSGTIYYSPTCFKIKVLPSVSYMIKL